MRIHVLSDLHIEFEPYEPARVDCDIVVLAGDIGVGTRGLEWISAEFQHIPAIYVAGNHEFYGNALPHLSRKLALSSQASTVTFLECKATTLDGVRFLGCTLWTDFHGTGDRSESMLAAQERMADYRRINTGPGFRKLRPQDTRLLHVASLDWLREAVKSSDEPTVVVTHHAPSYSSLGHGAEDDPVSAAFASRLDEWIRSTNIVLWIHGHTHRCVDYSIGSTRIVSNQKGYPDEPATGFLSDWVINL